MDNSNLDNSTNYRSIPSLARESTNSSRNVYNTIRVQSYIDRNPLEDWVNGVRDDPGIESRNWKLFRSAPYPYRADPMKRQNRWQSDVQPTSPTYSLNLVAVETGLFQKGGSTRAYGLVDSYTKSFGSRTEEYVYIYIRPSYSSHLLHIGSKTGCVRSRTGTLRHGNHPV